MLKNEYLKKVYADCEKRNAGESEFLQAVMEVLSSLEPVIEQDPRFEKAGVIERMVEPERMISCRVPLCSQRNRFNYEVLRLRADL